MKFWELIKCSKEFAPHYEILFGVAELGGARGQRQQPVRDGGKEEIRKYAFQSLDWFVTSALAVAQWLTLLVVRVAR